MRKANLHNAPAIKNTFLREYSALTKPFGDALSLIFHRAPVAAFVDLCIDPATAILTLNLFTTRIELGKISGFVPALKHLESPGKEQDRQETTPSILPLSLVLV